MIQISGRLVGQKYLRTVDQRTGNRYTLLLSAGKLVWERLVLGGKSHQF